jgi:Tubulin binding cofactor A
LTVTVTIPGQLHSKGIPEQVQFAEQLIMSSSSKPAAGDRKLKIQIGVCRRLVKEVAYYEAEVLTNEARVQKMRDDGKDVYGESHFE